MFKYYIDVRHLNHVDRCTVLSGLIKRLGKERVQSDDYVINFSYNTDEYQVENFLRNRRGRVIMNLFPKYFPA